MAGLDIFTRVTRRFSSAGEISDFSNPSQDKKLETSELFEQVFDKGEGEPKVKGSRLITKWKWRAEEETPEGQPRIIASQTLSNYRDAADLTTSAPSSIWTYRMAFWKQPKN